MILILECSYIELSQCQDTRLLRHIFVSQSRQRGVNSLRYAHLAPEHLVEAVRLSPLAGAAALLKGC